MINNLWENIENQSCTFVYIRQSYVGDQLLRKPRSMIPHNDSFGERYLEYKEIGRKFFAICPVSSRMRRCHTTPNNPTLFTVVVNVKGTDENPFQEAIDILIKSGHRFRWNLNLHSTILNLNEDKVSSDNIESIIHSMTDFFTRKKLPQMKLEFFLVHPGIWESHLTESDGTVIALGKEENNKQFLAMVNELKNYLNSIHNDCAKRKYNNAIWSTSGFFDEEDFSVDDTICEAFNHPKLRNFNHTVTISEIGVTEFRLKSLDDGLKHIIRP